MISLADYWMGRDRTYAAQLTDEIEHNAAVTVEKANQLLLVAGRKGGVNSGWRPPAVNAATPKAAKRSLHMTAQAVDLSDDDGSLGRWALNHLSVLAEIGLWMEHPSKTPGWLHVQTVPPKSGNRVFMP